MWLSLSLQRAPQAFLSVGISTSIFTCTLAQQLLITHLSQWFYNVVLEFLLKHPWRLCDFVDLSTFILSIWLKLSQIFALVPSINSLQSKVKAINSFSLIIISFPASLLHNQLSPALQLLIFKSLTKCSPIFFSTCTTILLEFVSRLLCFNWAILTCFCLKYPSPACLLLEL